MPYETTKTLVITENNKEVYRSIPNTSSITINPQSKPKGVYAKSHHVEGPFAHIFSKPFIVVAGTSGNKKESARIQMTINTLNKDWKFKYYSPCRVKSDKSITQTDIENYSLLLIGSPKTNLIFEKFGKQLPLIVTDNSVTIGNNKVNGTDLSFYAVAPNPYSSTNYIGIIGSNNVNSLTLRGEEQDNGYLFNDISNFGWYDYSIWASFTAEKLSNGYFDSDWE